MNPDHVVRPNQHRTVHEGGPLRFVLVHGSMDRQSGFARLVKHLRDFGEVVTYDRRGYGRSTPHSGPFGIEAQVADLIGLLEGRPAVLVGHSFGGNVALAAAERYPSLVKGVVVYETPLSWEPWWPGTTAGAAGRVRAADLGRSAGAGQPAGDLACLR